MKPEPTVWRTGKTNVLAVFFGLVVLITGLAFLVVSSGVTSGSGLEWTRGSTLGLIISVIGLAFMGYRRGLILDRGAGKVISQWGVWIPLYRRRRSLSEFREVVLELNRKQSAPPLGEVFEVFLRGVDPPLALTMEASDYEPARKLAERAASWLTLPLREEGGSEKVTAPDQVGVSLIERLRRSGAAEELPPPPETMRSRVDFTAEGLEVVMPPLGIKLNTLKRLGALILIMAAALTLSYLTGGRDNLTGHAMMYLFFFSLYCFYLVAVAVERVRMVVSPASLLVEKRFGPLKLVTEIPLGQLMEFEVRRLGQGAIAIFAYGDGRSVSVRGVLEEAPEYDYLVKLLNRRISEVSLGGNRDEAAVRYRNHQRQRRKGVLLAGLAGSVVLVPFLAIYFLFSPATFNYILGPAIHRAVLKGDREQVFRIIGRDPGQINRVTTTIGHDRLFFPDDTPLHVAAREGRPEICADLLEWGAPMNQRNFNGYTPLEEAVNAGRRDLAKILLDHGADPNISTDNGWSPLHEAAFKCRADLYQLLIDHGADQTARLDYGERKTPLDLARGPDPKSPSCKTVWELRGPAERPGE